MYHMANAGASDRHSPIPVYLDHALSVAQCHFQVSRTNLWPDMELFLFSLLLYIVEVFVD